MRPFPVAAGAIPGVPIDLVRRQAGGDESVPPRRGDSGVDRVSGSVRRPLLGFQGKRGAMALLAHAHRVPEARLEVLSRRRNAIEVVCGILDQLDFLQGEHVEEPRRRHEWRLWPQENEAEKEGGVRRHPEQFYGRVGGRTVGLTRSVDSLAHCILSS